MRYTRYRMFTWPRVWWTQGRIILHIRLKCSSSTNMHYLSCQICLNWQLNQTEAVTTARGTTNEARRCKRRQLRPWELTWSKEYLLLPRGWLNATRISNCLYANSSKREQRDTWQMRTRKPSTSRLYMVGGTLDECQRSKSSGART